ncbi:MAG: 2-amino-4-hydroxy-6-hydroxymethyldihydropteridine diphosphokinase [Synergistaceae bacterium]|nr:2-amino-4-hydroxy-6-hydroxymethyldihydropteridine diphosphokinase [Synergistaceae bacterium]
MQIYFGLGSNLGNRLQNLRDALKMLNSLGSLEAESDVFETPAWGGVEQPDYLNACVKINLTENLSPVEVLTRIKTFEREIGRKPSIRWGERKIDIDILLIDDLIYHDETLDIPHVRIPERLFVLVPLSEILPPDWKHPINGKCINEMINSLEPEEIIRITRL